MEERKQLDLRWRRTWRSRWLELLAGASIASWGWTGHRGATLMVPWSRVVPVPRSPHYANWVVGVAAEPACFCDALMCSCRSNSFRLSTYRHYPPSLFPAASPVSPPSAAVCSTSAETRYRRIFESNLREPCRRDFTKKKKEIALSDFFLCIKCL